MDTAIDIAIDICSAINDATEIGNNVAVDIDGTINDIESAMESAIYKIMDNAIDRSIDSAIDHHFFHAKTFTELANSLDKQKKMLPTNVYRIAPERWWNWTEGLQRTWLEALGFDEDFTPLSNEATLAFKKYLYANELLLRCKQSAVRVSRTAWESLETRLLTWEDENIEGKT